MGWLKYIHGGLAAAGGLLMAAAGVSPDDALSNLAHWAKFFHLDSAVPILNAKSADQYGILAGLLLVCLSLGLWIKARRTTLKDSSYWRHVQKLTIWQAAALWVGEKPVKDVSETSSIYPIFRLLKEAAASGRLRVIKRETPISKSYVHQSEIARFAKEIGVAPKFPFQENVEPKPQVRDERIGAWEVIWRRRQLLDGGSPEYTLNNAIEDFEATAKAAKFKVYGRDPNNAKYEAIPPSFWETGSIDALESMQPSGEGGVAQTRRLLMANAKKYIGLRVSSMEVEAAWPGTFTSAREDLEQFRTAARSISPLKMSVSETDPYSAHDYIGRGSVNHYWKVYKVRIENTDQSKTARNCRLRLISTEPETGYTLPVDIGKSFSIDAGRSELIPFVMYGEPDNPSVGHGDSFAVTCSENKHPTYDIDKKYRLRLRLTAEDMPYSEYECLIWVDNGKFRIKPVDQVTV
jgi:hypothetical protein